MIGWKDYPTEILPHKYYQTKNVRVIPIGHKKNGKK